MFTGIVQGQQTVRSVQRLSGLSRIVLELAPTQVEGLVTGASIAVNGVCLTVTHINGCLVGFDIIRETLDLTNLGGLEAGDLVNIERSMRMGDEIGGHILSGHVHGMARIDRIVDSDNNRQVELTAPAAPFMQYILHKGFVALNGASLTVAAVDAAAARMTVCLIPETLARTTFGTAETGQHVNVEVDSQTQTVVDTTRAFLRQYLPDYLADRGLQPGPGQTTTEQP